MNKTHFNNAVAFGAELIKTRDLDPVYVAMVALPKKELPRALLAYSCLYHLGAAGYLGTLTGNEFWDKLEEAAINEEGDWPRGTERRHWRGKNATSSVAWFRANFEKPEQVVHNWYWSAKRQTFSAIADRVRLAPSFGPWIAFKVADMLDRVLALPVDFSDCELGIYRDPAYGAALLYYGDEIRPATPKELQEVIQALLDSPLGKLQAPPFFDRRINVQEVETILCKYKSHCHGHYPMGKDTREVIHGLSDPRWGQRATKMKTVLEEKCGKITRIG